MLVLMSLYVAGVTAFLCFALRLFVLILILCFPGRLYSLRAGCTMPKLISLYRYPVDKNVYLNLLQKKLYKRLHACRLTGKPVLSHPCHRIDTQPEVRLRVGAFNVGVLVFSAAAIFLASVHGKCLRYTEDVDVVVTKKNSSLLTLERGRWIRMLCDSSNLHKENFVEPKPLASKMGPWKKWDKKMAKSYF